MKHCDTCCCESDAQRKERIKREADERKIKEREAEFVRCHSVLTDDDLRWARSMLPGNRR